jgi:nucleoredoxin
MGRFLVPIAGVMLVLGMTFVAGLFLPPSPDSHSAFAPASSSPASSSSSSTGDLTPFAASLDGHLVIMNERTLESYDVSKLKGVKYWAFYCSASWCPPCRAFTPKLVDFYKAFKPTHPNFELIFVNLDENEDGMESYMIDDGMPWPAVKFAERRSSEVGIDKYFGQYIPDLVLVDSNGNVLSDTNVGGNYLGPEKVMDDIPSMVPTP